MLVDHALNAIREIAHDFVNFRAHSTRAHAERTYSGDVYSFTPFSLALESQVAVASMHDAAEALPVVVADVGCEFPGSAGVVLRTLHCKRRYRNGALAIVELPVTRDPLFNRDGVSVRLIVFHCGHQPTLDSLLIVTDAIAAVVAAKPRPYGTR